MSCFLKDTVEDAASLNISVLGKVELNEFAEATGVIVVDGLCVPKCFHDGTADRQKYDINSQNLAKLRVFKVVLSCRDSTCSAPEPAPPWWSSLTEEYRRSSDSSLRGTSAAAWCSQSSRHHSPRWSDTDTGISGSMTSLSLVLLRKCPHWPDEDALTVVPLPQAAVTLVGHGEDVRRQLAHLVFAVQVDRSAVVQACYLLIWVYRRENRTYVGLDAETMKQINYWWFERRNKKNMQDRGLLEPAYPPRIWIIF